MAFLQDLQKFRVHLTELTEVSGTVWKSHRTHRSSGYGIRVPVPRVLWQGRTGLTEVSGTGMNVVQNSQKFRVRVWKSFRAFRISGTGSTGLWCCTYPTEHNHTIWFVWRASAYCQGYNTYDETALTKRLLDLSRIFLKHQLFVRVYSRTKRGRKTSIPVCVESQVLIVKCWPQIRSRRG